MKIDHKTEYDYPWRRFSTETSIHGLIYLNKKEKLNRLVWLPIILIALTLCCWQSGINIRDYFSFNVITKVTYTTEHDIEFPAITIFNLNIMRRTVIGRRQEAEMLLAYKFGLDVRKVHKTCDYKPEHQDGIDLELSKVVARLSAQNDNALNQKDIDRMFDLIVVNRQMTFAACWVQSEQKPCQEVVMNTVVQTNGYINPSYSINLDPSVAEIFRDARVFGISLRNENVSDDMNIKSWETKNLRDNGYSFLLNVNEAEYCFSQQKIWYGVGLHATIHERRAFPSEADTMGTILLKPGYRYDVVLKPKHYRRQTESLGKCVQNYHSYMFQTTSYVKKICELECITEIIWKNCRCTFVSFPKMVQAIARRYNVNENQTEWCWSNDRLGQCLDDLHVLDSNFPVESICDQCKKPCDETEYTYDVTSTRFPPKHLSGYYRRLLNVSHDEIVSKNYLLLNVFFESNWVSLIEDSQAFTLKDMFTYIGNNVGLFFGMSFISFYEIVHYLTQLVRAAYQSGWFSLGKIKKIIVGVRRALQRRKKKRLAKKIRKKYMAKRKQSVMYYNARNSVISIKQNPVISIKQIRNVKVRPSISQ